MKEENTQMRTFLEGFAKSRMKVMVDKLMKSHNIPFILRGLWGKFVISNVSVMYHSCEEYVRNIQYKSNTIRGNMNSE